MVPMDEISKEVIKQGFKQATELVAPAVVPVTTEIGRLLALPFKFISSVAFYLPQKAIILFEGKIKEYEIKQRAKLEQIPEEYIIEPKLNIIAPAIEGVALNLDDDNLVEMFSELIKNACDSSVEEKVHPQHVNILKSMSGTDAVVFRYLARQSERQNWDVFYTQNDGDAIVSRDGYVPRYLFEEIIGADDVFQISDSFERLLNWGLFEVVFVDGGNASGLSKIAYTITNIGKVFAGNVLG